MLSRDNLQEFCRTCLKSLASADATMQYNIFLVPNFQKLLVFFTSVELSNPNAGDDDADAYPKQLCQICYYKLLDFNEFRELASRSAQTLHSLVKGIVSDEALKKQPYQNVSLDAETSDPLSVGVSAEQLMERNKPMENQRRGDHTNNNKNNYDDDDNDDNKLLLPELANYRILAANIKNEPPEALEEEEEVSETPTTSNTGGGGKTDKQNNVEFIKKEVDWPISNDDDDNEADKEGGDAIDRALFEQQNYAAMEEHDSIADGADDEEHALRNGAANVSSEGLLLSPAGTSQQRHGNDTRATANSTRKRDRNKKSFKCPRCEKTAYKQIYLDAHIRRDHEGHEKPFRCSECQKAFTRYNQLHVHIQSSHPLPQRFVCEFDGCNATFRLSNTLETHRKVKHRPSVVDSGATFSVGLQTVMERQLRREMELEHICPQCCKKYSSKRTLSEHLKRHAQIKQHTCTMCGAAKVTRTELQIHMRTHDPTLEKFTCPQCPQEFNHKNAISRHIRVVHEGQRRYTCSFCPRRFGTRNSQVCHERLHTGERPFTCELCDKGFTQMEGLKSHMKSHDKSLRKHICTYCSQRFITRKNLVDHELRHRGDKPFICGVCGRGFASDEDLAAHRTVHADDDSENSSALE